MRANFPLQSWALAVGVGCVALTLGVSFSFAVPVSLFPIRTPRGGSCGGHCLMQEDCDNLCCSGGIEQAFAREG